MKIFYVLFFFHLLTLHEANKIDILCNESFTFVGIKSEGVVDIKNNIGNCILIFCH